MLRRLEELRRAASNSDLRSAYETAIGSLDGVAYRLAMLRSPDAPRPARRPAETSVPAPPRSAPKTAAAPTRAARQDWRDAQAAPVRRRFPALWRMRKPSTAADGVRCAVR
jgi:hypothetical protein